MLVPHILSLVRCQQELGTAAGIGGCRALLVYMVFVAIVSFDSLRQLICFPPVFSTPADANKKKPTSYSDYESLVLKWRGQEDYEVIQKIGRGKYSEGKDENDHRSINSLKLME